MSFFKKLFGNKPKAVSDSKSNTPDFSAITSLEDAKLHAKQGTLAPIYLMPLEFGGPDIPQNIVYVPAAVTDVYNQLIGTVRRFAEDGLITNMQVNPGYKGDSFVPSTLSITTSHDDKPGSFNPTIEIW